MRELFFVFFLFLLWGCCTEYRPEEYLNSWNQPPVTIGPERKWSQYKGKVQLVKKDKMTLAENFLEKVSVLEVSPDQVLDLVGRQEPLVGSNKFYLIRGLYIYTTGRFEVKLSGDALWVRHSSHGPCRIPDSRQAIVLQLDQKPGLVYVTCSGYR